MHGADLRGSTPRKGLDRGPTAAAETMKILSAKFLTAAQDPKSYPRGGLKEIAFAGRSNVGKSSAINTLLGRQGLVKTSKTPGHTRKLNFFLINERFIFVDFPGYGFARVPLEVKRKWGPMVETYLKARKQLAAVVVVVDVRRSLTESDAQVIEYIASHGISVIVAATKADKLSHSRRLEQRQRLEAELGGRAPVVLFSSHTGLGKNELWKEIKNLIE